MPAHPAIEIEEEGQPGRPVGAVALAALGVVFGDIGTSPLYAFNQCFLGEQAMAPTADNVLGILSLIVWSLILVVSVKYLVFVLRADNRGEGGIIALVALINPWRSPPGSGRNILMLIGLFGAALLYGDGTITPAISVLSAVEGLKVATPAFEPFIVPISIVILMALFSVQYRGTAAIGAVFGPVMLIWFAAMGVAGLVQIMAVPEVLKALLPYYAMSFLGTNGMAGFVVLGTVFLVVTGAETLYADMGHFGRDPIKLAWFVVALPALLMNYFGQGALVLTDPVAAMHPFYGLVAPWALYPMVALATLATVIASQAVIAGTFSLTRQAIQLGQLPRARIVQTAAGNLGQIYIPGLNWMLMAATVLLILAFRSSENLAAAYGLAVSTDMVITTVLALFVALRWGWRPVVAGLLAAGFLVLDLAFFGANLFKIGNGGWYPLVLAVIVFLAMTVWRGGLRRLHALTDANRVPFEAFLGAVATSPPQRVPGTAVFLTASRFETPLVLTHHVDHNKILHERVILVTVQTADEPRVSTANRIELQDLQLGFHRVLVRYGFMQNPNIPVALRLCERLGLKVEPSETTFYLGHEEVIPASTGPLLRRVEARAFAFMWRNATRTTSYYKIPADRVVAIGMQVEL
jgi:KUP system potassium uptake protein